MSELPYNKRKLGGGGDNRILDEITVNISNIHNVLQYIRPTVEKSLKDISNIRAKDRSVVRVSGPIKLVSGIQYD